MLVLTRRVGETLIIGEGVDAIRITISEVNGRNSVRLAIDAPQNIRVFRSEMLDEADSDPVG